MRCTMFPPLLSLRFTLGSVPCPVFTFASLSPATSGLFLTPSGVFFIANITTFIPRSLTWEPHAYAHTPLVQVLVSERRVRPCHASSLQSGIVLGQRTSKCVSSSAVGRAVTGDEWVPCTLGPVYCSSSVPPSCVSHGVVGSRRPHGCLYLSCVRGRSVRSRGRVGSSASVPGAAESHR